MKKKIIIILIILILIIAAILLFVFREKKEEPTNETNPNNYPIILKVSNNIVKDYQLEAELIPSTSTTEFVKLLEKDSITIKMRDYNSFEKVGELGTTITRNDANITTKPGDIILYQGNQITIYYDENTYNFTKLGEIKNISQEKLKSILGPGDCEITFSIKK